MCFSYKDVDGSFMLDNERLDIAQIEDLRALGLRKNEVEEEGESDPRIEWHPPDDEEGPGFDEKGQGQDGEVDEPGCRLGRVGGSQGLVGEVCGEEDGEDGAEEVRDETEHVESAPPTSREQGASKIASTVKVLWDSFYSS